MEIQQLKGFLAVARYQNFTIAARKTQRTQPTISLQIKALEDELGVKLFERVGSKQVTLTTEGQILQRIAAPLVQEFMQISMRFREAQGVYESSTVCIATHSSIMVYMLPNIIKQFSKNYPDCQLKILNRNQDQIVEMVENGEADFGVTSLDSVPAHMHYRIFNKVNRILIANHDHPIVKKSQITLSDIAAYPLILPTPESSSRKMIDLEFERENLEYTIAMEVVGRSAIKTYVGMGFGISIINEYYVSNEDKKTLFVKNMSRYFGKAETGILYKKNRTLSSPAQTFIELICKNGQAN
ncbi:MAG: LysR family transcriptional regulator [Deltaproteobacteria bacterium]|nr:LysR family transcriptional regulator [Deltaproteobacteria bacterium]